MAQISFLPGKACSEVDTKSAIESLNCPTRPWSDPKTIAHINLSLVQTRDLSGRWNDAIADFVSKSLKDFTADIDVSWRENVVHGRTTTHEERGTTGSSHLLSKIFGVESLAWKVLCPNVRRAAEGHV